MRNRHCLFFWLAFYLPAAQGCAPHVDDSGNLCDQYDAKVVQWAGEACSGKDEVCCSCMCSNQDKFFDVTKWPQDQICECVDFPECVDNPQTPGDECVQGPCEGTRLQEAEECLGTTEAEATCKAEIQAPVNTLCTNTAFP